MLNIHVSVSCLHNGTIRIMRNETGKLWGRMAKINSDFYLKQQKIHSEMVQQWLEAFFFFPENIQINHVMLNEPVNHALTRKLCTLEKVFWPMPAVTGHRNEAYRSLTNCRDAISNSNRKESIPCWTTYVLISWSPQRGALPGGTSDKCSHGRTWRCFWRRGSSPVCGKKN